MAPAASLSFGRFTQKRSCWIARPSCKLLKNLCVHSRCTIVRAADGARFPTASPTLAALLLPESRRRNRGEAVSYCGFNLHLCHDEYVSIFSCTCQPFVYHLFSSTFLCFLMQTVFKVFIEFVTTLLLFYDFFLFVFCFLTLRHVRSWLPYQGSNPHALHWKVKP